MITKAKIFGSPEQQQLIWVEFEVREESKWLHHSYFHIEACQVLTPLELKPSDISIDIQQAIAEALGINPFYVKMDAEVQLHEKQNLFV